VLEAAIGVRLKHCIGHKPGVLWAGRGRGRLRTVLLAPSLPALLTPRPTRPGGSSTN
jgi:hypothetical protein